MTVANRYICVAAAALGAAAGLLPAAGTKARFYHYQLEARTAELFFFDLDGNQLDDIVALNEPNLIFFFQDPNKGFASRPNLVHSLGDRPSIFWAAKLGLDPRDSILVTTADGVSKLNFVNRNTPPLQTTIISRKTIVPQEAEDNRIVSLELSANTAKGSPAVFVPTENALEVWEYSTSAGWRYEYSLKDALKSGTGGPWNKYVYRKAYYLQMAVADVNGDGLDDLLICGSDYGRGTGSMTVYQQKEGGRFEKKTARTLENAFEEHEWFCLIDLNKDGKIDLIRNTWLREPWFILGTYSGKVLVRIFMTMTDGNIPDEPQYVFRKNDWLASMPIVDIDGDGFTDLVLGHSLFKIDDARKSLSAQRIDHSLRIHFYDNGGFRQEPDLQRNVSIYLGHRDIFLPGPRSGYFDNFINLEGDFNADGRRDLLVRDEKGEASVYFFKSRRHGFSKKPDVRLKTKEMCSFIVRDLNRDGISDLVAYYPWRKTFRVSLSKKD